MAQEHIKPQVRIPKPKTSHTLCSLLKCKETNSLIHMYGLNYIKKTIIYRQFKLRRRRRKGEGGERRQKEDIMAQL